MANYVKATNFAAKDSLPSGNSGKIIKGTEIDTEFNAIASAVASKTDSNSPVFTGTPTAPTATGGTSTTQLATTAFVAGEIVTERTTTATLTNKTLTSPTINGGTVSSLATPLAVASGGTGTSTPSLVAGTNITISGSFPNQTINASASGVTSVATGNGLQGGPITTTGTLSVACPTFNTVGSYAFVYMQRQGSNFNVTSGSNYGVGTGNNLQSGAVTENGTVVIAVANNNLSGSWKWMGAGNLDNNPLLSLACRVS